MRAFYGFLVPFLLLLTGCQLIHYPEIPRDHSIIISVNLLEKSLSFVDAETGKEEARWSLKNPVTGALLMPDDDTLMTYGEQMEEVIFYKLSTGREVDSWEVGEGIVHAMIGRDGETIYLVDEGTDSVRYFNRNGEEQASVKVGRDPSEIIQSEDGSKLYVINFHDSSASVIDVRNQTVENTFSVAAYPAGGVLHENELWLGGHGEGAEVQRDITIYGTENMELIDHVNAPAMPIDIIAYDGNIFSLSHGSNKLRKINPETRESIGEVVVGANPFDVLAAKGKLYIASYDSSEIIVVDPKTLRINKLSDVGKGPFHLLFREGTNDE